MPLAPGAPLNVRRGRGGRPYERLKRQVFAEETHCWVCHEYVDQTLWYQLPMARSLDHVTPLNEGGDPLARDNARLAHKRCNTIRSNQARAKPKEIKDRGHIEIDPSTI